VPFETKSTDIVFSYQFDKATGNYEQIMVPRKQQLKKMIKLKKLGTRKSEPVPISNTQVYKDHRVGITKVVKDPLSPETMISMVRSLVFHHSFSLQEIAQ
jgi:hypothetical protein